MSVSGWSSNLSLFRFSFLQKTWAFVLHVETRRTSKNDRAKVGSPLSPGLRLWCYYGLSSAFLLTQCAPWQVILKLPAYLFSTQRHLCKRATNIFFLPNWIDSSANNSSKRVLIIAETEPYKEPLNTLLFEDLENFSTYASRVHSLLGNYRIRVNLQSKNDCPAVAEQAAGLWQQGGGATEMAL